MKTRYQLIAYLLYMLTGVYLDSGDVPQTRL